MLCITCGKDFESVRATAKFCSGACKFKYRRQGNATLSKEKLEPVVSGTSVPNATLSDSDNATLTPTDKDLADHLPSYLPKNWYKYSNKVFKRMCATCSKTYSTKLELNRYCSNVCKMSQLTTAPQT